MKEYLTILLSFLVSISAHHEVHLVPADKICPNGTGVHNILLPDPKDCSVYYRCENGIAVPQSCPPGLDWCQVLQNCTLPMLANCTLNHIVVTYSPEELATYNPNSSTENPDTTTINTPIPDKNICPTNGSTLPNPLDCTTYYICADENPTLTHCPVGLTYSCWDQECLSSSSSECLPTEGQSCSKPGENLPNSQDCHSYYECINGSENGKVVLVHCSYGLEFNAWFGKCVNNSLSHCKHQTTTLSSETTETTTNTPSPLCPKPGLIYPSYKYCNAYMICDNKRQLKTNICDPPEFHYNCETKKCENITHCCSTTVTAPSPTTRETTQSTGGTSGAGETTHSTGGTSGPGETTHSTGGTPSPGETTQSTGGTSGPGETTHSTGGTSGPGETTQSTGGTSSPGETTQSSEGTSSHGETTHSTGGTSGPGETTHSTGGTPSPGETTQSTGGTSGPGETTHSTGGTSGPGETTQSTGGTSSPGETTQSSEGTSSHGETTHSTGGTSGSAETTHSTGGTPSPGETTHSTGGTPSPGETTQSTGGTSSPGETTHSTGGTSGPGETTQSTGGTSSPGETTHSTGGTSGAGETTHSTGGTPSPGETTQSTGGTSSPGETTHSTGGTSGPGETTQSTGGTSSPGETTHSTGGTSSPGETTQSSEGTSSHGETTHSTGGTSGPGETTHSTGGTPSPGETTHSTGGTPSPGETTQATGGTSSSGETTHSTGGTSGPGETTQSTGGTSSPGETTQSTGGTSGPGETTQSSEGTSGPGETTTPKPSPLCPMPGLLYPSYKYCNAYSECDKNRQLQTKICKPVTFHYNCETKKCENITHCCSPTTITTTAPETTGPGETTQSTGGTSSSGETTHSTGGTSGPGETTQSTGGTSSPGETTHSTGGTSSPGETTQSTGGTSSPGETTHSTKGTSSPGETTHSTGGTSSPGETTQSSEGTSSHGETTHSTGGTSSPGETTQSSEGTSSHGETTQSTGGTSGPGETTHSTGGTPSPEETTHSTGGTPSPGETTQSTGGTSGPGETTQSSEGTSGPGETTTPKPSPLCPMPGLLYPSYKYCNAYSECDKNRQLKTKICKPVTFHYNCETKKCENITHCCSPTTITTTAPETTITTSPTNPTTEPCPLDGVKLPNPLDCNSYFTCEKGELVKMRCPTGEIYSCWDQECKKPEDATCILEGSQGGGKCSTEGEKQQNVEDCGTYYQCVNGTIVLKSCPYGEVYNELAGECQTNSSKDCKTYPTNKPSHTLRPTSTTIPPTSEPCPLDGFKLPNPLDCNSYFTCEKGKLVKKPCPAGEIYSCWDQKCKKPEDATCILDGSQEGGKCSTEGEKQQNVEDCGTYYQCCNGTIELIYCPHGEIYNAMTRKCQNNSLNDCETYPTHKPSHTLRPPPTTIPTSPEDENCPFLGATLPNPLNCTTYYICNNNKPKLENCPSGQGYSCWNQQCESGALDQCIPNKEIGQNCSIEGLQQSDNEHCDKYLICENGKIKQEHCRSKTEYNPWYQKCMPSQYSHCKSGSTAPTPTMSTPEYCILNGVKLPNPLDCNSYYTCEKRKIVEKHCAAGKTYSCWDQECKKQKDATCILDGSQEGGKCSKDGDRQQNVGDCSSYYQCNHKKIVSEKCPDGQTFDIWTKNCESDSTTRCETYTTIEPPTSPPIKGNCRQEGAKLPNPSDCKSYYICKKGEPILKNCSDNQIYSCWDQECKKPKDATCILDGSQEGGKCSKDGDRQQNVGDCSSYYQCNHKKIVSEKCPDGQTFDIWTKNCESDSTTRCETYTTIEPPTSPPIKGNCRQEGAKLPNPSDCKSYYICKKGEPILKNCSDNQIYSCWDQECKKPKDATCILDDSQEGGKCPKDGDRQQYVKDCGSYYQCIEKKIVHKKCPDGQNYAIWTKTCQSNSTTHCEPIEPNPDYDLCPIEGALIPNPADCAAYYKCINHIPTLEKCPSGTEYNCWDQKCESNGRESCVSLGSQNGLNCSIDGLQISDVSDCNKYLECIKGIIHEKNCPAGLEFNSPFQKCVKPICAHCKTFTTITTDYTPPPTSTTPSVNDNCPQEGALQPNPLNCSTYFKCVNGTPTPELCADNYEYSCWNEECEPKNEAKCIAQGDQLGSKCKYNGQKLQNPEDCHSFYMCVNGTVIMKKCSLNWYYNKWFKCCVPLEILGHCKPISITTPPFTTPTTTTLAPGPPDHCPIDALIPNPLDCSAYYKCIENKPTPQKCPSGKEYSCWDQECKKASTGLCINNGIQPGQNCSRDGVKLSNLESCSSYYECVNGKVEKQSCFLGFEYSKWYQKCVLFLFSHCSTYTHTTPPTTTPPTIPTPNPIYDTCPIEGALFPNLVDCTKYYICVNNTPTIEPCSEGMKYSCWDQKCEKDVDANCIAKGTQDGANCTIDGLRLPNIQNCSSYYECTNGKSILKHCDQGLEFNDRYQSCYPPPKAYCHVYPIITPPTGTTPTSPTTPNTGYDVCPVDGVLMPNPLNCSIYYKCTNGIPVPELCALGLEYNCWNQECEPKGEAQCIDVKPPESCKKNRQTNPDPSDCHKYFECVNYVIVTKTCPNNWYYNKWFKYCVSDEELAHCNETTTLKPLPSTRSTTTIAPPSGDYCPHNDATIANPTDCSSYYKCFKNKQNSILCPKGEKYSAWDQCCKKASEAQCINVGSPIGKYCSRDGVRLQNLESCTSYLECESGIVEKKNCFIGTKYNRWSQKCELNLFSYCITYPTIPPPPTTTPKTTSTKSTTETISGPIVYPLSSCSKNKEKVANCKNCKQYYYCDKKTTELYTCPPGYNYDCWSEDCVPASEARCANNPNSWVGKSCPKNNRAVSDCSSCQHYYICKHNIIQKESCSRLDEYSVWHQKCENIRKAKCWYNLP